MSMSDTFGDFITRIRNAYIAGSSSVIVPGYKMNCAVLKIMESEGFILSFTSLGSADDMPRSSKAFRPMKVNLRYTGSEPALVSISRVSKPSRRVYSEVSDLELFYNGFGIYILTTVKGVITDHQARSLKVGGEVLCSVF